MGNISSPTDLYPTIESLQAAQEHRKTIKSSTAMITKYLTPQTAIRFNHAVADYAPYLEVQGEIGSYEEFVQNLEYLSGQIQNMKEKEKDTFIRKLRPLLANLDEHAFAEDIATHRTAMFDRIFSQWGTPAYRNMVQQKRAQESIVETFEETI